MTTYGWEPPPLPPPPTPLPPEPPAIERELRVIIAIIVVILVVGGGLAIYTATRGSSKHNRATPVVSTTTPIVTVPLIAPTRSVTLPRFTAPSPAPIARIKRWDLASDLLAHPSANPAPDAFGNAGVWGLLESKSLAHDGNYTPLPHFARAFSVPGLSAWYGDTQTCFPLPVIGVNTTPGVLHPCTVTLPPRAVLVHPDSTRMPVVAWHSPITGQITIAGATSDLDGTCGDGVSIALDKGTASVLRARLGNGALDREFSFSAHVTTGDTYYFMVDPGPVDSIICDATRMDLNIATIPSP